MGAFRRKELTAMVLVDMSKAFASISHENLISKVLDVGASYPCLQNQKKLQ